MKIARHVHALKIPFRIPISPDTCLDREVWVYLLLGKRVALIDSGVWGARASITAYLELQERTASEISHMILTHSHPDHMGGARSVHEETGCTVWAHESEQDWIEDTELQFRERPVPGFYTLVEGPVPVGGLLSDGDEPDLDPDIPCRVFHTPGHSKGSVSLLLLNQKTLISGDAVPVPGDIPIYEDISECVRSLKMILGIPDVEFLLSSWEAPIAGARKVRKRVTEGLAWMHQIHEAVTGAPEEAQGQPMELCRYVAGQLRLPPHTVNPLVARAFWSSLGHARPDFSCLHDLA